VYVQEGDMVRRGDTLISFDKTAAKARYDEVHQRYLGMRATEGRLLAEMRGANAISFHSDLLRELDRDLAERNMENQRHLFAARQTTMRILQEQLRGVRSLVSEGYAPLSQQRDLELKIAELQASTAAQLAQVQLEVDADAESVFALAKALTDMEILAPVDGQVIDLQKQTVGAVIQPGQKIMEIVPLDEGLLIEVKVAPHLIDSIHNGLPVDLSFSSFAHSPHLVVEGTVLSVSKDIVTDPHLNPMYPGSTYYLARIEVTQDGLNKLGHRNMQPGMPVQAVIKTGERSLLTYLLNPLYKRIAISMKEE